MLTHVLVCCEHEILENLHLTLFEWCVNLMHISHDIQYTLEFINWCICDVFKLHTICDIQQTVTQRLWHDFTKHCQIWTTCIYYLHNSKRHLHTIITSRLSAVHFHFGVLNKYKYSDEKHESMMLCKDTVKTLVWCSWTLNAIGQWGEPIRNQRNGHLECHYVSIIWRHYKHVQLSARTSFITLTLTSSRCLPSPFTV